MLSSPQPAGAQPADALSILNIRNILTIAMVGFAIWLIVLLKSVFALFLSAMVIAFLIYPVVRWMSALPLGRGRTLGTPASVLVVYLVIFSLLSVMILLVGGVLEEQARALLAAVQGGVIESKVQDLKFWVQANTALFKSFRMEATDVTARIDEFSRHYLGPEAVQELLSWLGTNLDPVKILGNAGNAIAVLFTMPILVFYMVTDAKPIRSTLMSFVPPAFTGATTGFLEALERTLNNYLRGQIKLGFAIFLLDAILLLCFVPSLTSWLLIALIAGVTEIIPVVGPTIALIVALVVGGLETGGDWPTLLKIIIIFTGVQMLENQLLVPRIMGKQLDVHPLTVMFFLLAGGILGGLIGALLSLPIAATLKVMVQQYYPTFIRRVQALLVDDSKPVPTPGVLPIPENPPIG